MILHNGAPVELIQFEHQPDPAEEQPPDTVQTVSERGKEHS